MLCFIFVLVVPWNFQLVLSANCSLVVGSFHFPPYLVVHFVAVTVVTAADGFTSSDFLKLVAFPLVQAVYEDLTVAELLTTGLLVL